MWEKWTSRGAFILAAIWSAVWLWNARRFPWLCAEFWWGAFLIAYTICMLFLGVPILMAEIAIWRKIKKSAPHSLKALNNQAKYVGRASVTNAFFMLTYYVVVFAWCILMCLMSYRFATTANTTETASALWQNTIGATFSTSLTDWWWEIAPLIILCFIIARWFVYWCIRNWAKQVGKVVKYTVLLPVILLIILALSWFISNPHLGEALEALFIPNFELFKTADLWISAMWQAFFSLSIVSAVMFTYWSYLKSESNIAVDTLIIAFSDLWISILSWIVLFTTMYSTGLTVTDMSASGIATAFIIYPTAIVNLTSNWILNAIFGFVFYFMLCTLAIDSSFSMLEWVASAVKDKFNINRKKAAKIVAVTWAILWIAFLTRAWVSYLDITDNWVCQYGMIILGILETIFIWWIFKPKRVLEEINKNTKKIRIPKRWFYSSIKFIAPILLSILFTWQFIDYAKKWFRYDTNYSLTAEIIFWRLIFIIVITSWFILNSILKRNKKWRIILELNNKEPKWDEINE